MVVGIFLYNYIPNDITVAKAKTYQASSETTKVLSDAQDTGNLLGELTGNNNNTEDDIKTTIILQTYQVTSQDLKRYERVHEYTPGLKADPFDEPKIPVENTTSNGQSTNSGTSENTGNSSDNTLFGTSNQK